MNSGVAFIKLCLEFAFLLGLRLRGGKEGRGGCGDRGVHKLLNQALSGEASLHLLSGIFYRSIILKPAFDQEIKD